MKQRADPRTEVKTRLTDAVYDELQLFKTANGFDSDSAALSALVEKALFGANYPLRDLMRRRTGRS